jgi:hypothetical protein
MSQSWDDENIGPRAAARWENLAQWFANRQDPPAPAPRGVVSEEDACHALLQAAMAVNATLTQRGGRLDGALAGHIMAMLMVARDFVRPLPADEQHDVADACAADLQRLVDIMRTALLDADEFGGGSATNE